MGASAPSSDDLPAFDEADPAAYYLVDNREEMETLSDAALVAGGVSLPVHSHVLSLQSGVLRRMFVDFCGTERGSSVGSSGSSSVGSSERGSPDSKRSVVDKEGELVLAQPLDGCSAYEAALFLRFCYRPDDMCEENLEAVESSLPTLLRLAHKLEVGGMLQEVAQHMTDASASSSFKQLVVWADAAEQCEQADLRLTCAAQLAQRLILARTPGVHALPAGIADAAQLEGCSNSMLLLILGLVTGTARQEQLQASVSMFGLKAGVFAKQTPRGQPGACVAPAADGVAAAVQQAASPGSYVWRIEKSAQQPAQQGRVLRSPWFMAGGREWRVLAYLNGTTQESEGYVSLYLAARHAVTTVASATLTICDQDVEDPQHVAASFEDPVTTCGWGFGQFMPVDQLRSRPSYLTGDALVIRAEVRMLL